MKIAMWCGSRSRMQALARWWCQTGKLTEGTGASEAEKHASCLILRKATPAAQDPKAREDGFPFETGGGFLALGSDDLTLRYEEVCNQMETSFLRHVRSTILSSFSSRLLFKQKNNQIVTNGRVRDARDTLA